MPIQPSKLLTDPISVAAIVLAAGASTRLGRPKQLLRPNPLSGETLVDHAIAAARAGGARPIFVVLGAAAEEIQREAGLQDCAVVHNEEWAEGMASSVRAGVSAVLEQVADTSGVLLLVCDQPGLTAEHVGMLLAAHSEEPAGIAASRYAGRLGVPAVLPRALFPALLKLQGDRGARSLFETSGVAIRAVEFPEGAWDIDSAEDLQRLPSHSSRKEPG